MSEEAPPPAVAPAEEPAESGGNEAPTEAPVETAAPAEPETAPEAPPAESAPPADPPAADAPADASPDTTADAAPPPTEAVAADEPAAAEPAPASNEPAAASPADAPPAAESAPEAAEPEAAPAAATATKEAAEAAPAPADAAAAPSAVLTNVNDSPEAKAELEAIAKKEAINVIHARRSSSAGSRPSSGKPVPAPDSKPSSAVGEKAKAPPSPQPAVKEPAPVEAQAPPEQAPEEPAPAPAADAASADGMPELAASVARPGRSGPWLTGTFRLPKSGKLISGEELCNALERMTNAYIDKYLKLGETGMLLYGGTAGPGGTVRGGKSLSTDELDSLITRLYTPKDKTSSHEKLERVVLRFDENGKEIWAPVKRVSPEEQQAYMVELYDRCLESKRKTAEGLAAKYLKPLGQLRKF